MFEEAIKDFTRVLEIDASSSNAFFCRGSTHDRAGNYPAAAADYTRALELDRAAGGGSGVPLAVVDGIPVRTG